ncbi:plasma-membrane proton-efflux P-type ATPase [Batrachochytrium salamandrivorans]|nr:plasma-membrane proton-efflux P-type ATPase [Batrachochytrium salamandrivorans]
MTMEVHGALGQLEFGTNERGYPPPFYEAEEHRPCKTYILQLPQYSRRLPLNYNSSVFATCSNISLAKSIVRNQKFLKRNQILSSSSLAILAVLFRSLLEAAALVSAILGDWVDFIILIVVLIANAVIGFHEEAKAESALDALKNTLALKCRAWRNGVLVEVDSALLVPGDVIALRLGDIVPADARLLGIGVTGAATEGTLQIDQAALTGESLPVSKGKGSIVYSSSIVKQGQQLAVVTKTGLHTFIGRAANLISITTEEGHFQKVINQIGNFLIIITVVMVVIIMIVYLTIKPVLNEEGHVVTHFGERFKLALKQVLVLTIAAIPVGLPTVMSATMAVGASQLAKKQVIVKRLTAIEELASVSILCSDKTGTLTLNQLSFDKPYLANRGSNNANPEGNGTGRYTEDDLLLSAYFASEPGAPDPIEKATREAAQERVKLLRDRVQQDHNIPGYHVDEFLPFNPNSKYTEATVTNTVTGEKFRCIKGNAAVIDLARRGLRALGVARTSDPERKVFELIGMISLLDPPRPDSAQTIKECGEYGVGVRMITGDQLIIAKEVAHRLGMQRAILDSGKLIDPNINEEALTDRCIKADGFAQVIPEHKYRVVELMQKRGLLVGMTGDGVNDAPALKKANVGIAVEGCTDAARSAADIVLLAPGLSTIVDGIKTSRAIFQRMRSYALYRIASTIHFLIFFFISMLAFDFYLPDRLIIIIAVLNDAATLVIAFDNAKISKRPDKWRLGQLISLSFVLGFLLMCISFAHYFVARALVHDADPKIHAGIIQTIMYLQISSCPHFVIFSTRVETWFWTSVPSWTFVLAIVGTQVIAMFMSIYGASFLYATAIGWGWGVSIIFSSFVFFIFLDAVKVFVISKWSFELTAELWPVPSRRAKLLKRREDAILHKRVHANIAKLRRAAVMAGIVGHWRDVTLSSRKHHQA